VSFRHDLADVGPDLRLDVVDGNGERRETVLVDPHPWLLSRGRARRSCEAGERHAGAGHHGCRASPPLSAPVALPNITHRDSPRWDVAPGILERCDPFTLCRRSTKTFRVPRCTLVTCVFTT